mgnify:CR=1 FL=1
MTTNKRKKVIKYRGYTTHGGGHRKKRRGAGSRGGRGNAGSGKKGKAKKPSSPKLGKKGFHSLKKKINTINISELNKLIKNNKVEAKEGVYNLDLTSLGYQKLLGLGKTKLKLKIKISRFSKLVEEKIKGVGGEIVSTSSPAEEK